MGVNLPLTVIAVEKPALGVIQSYMHIGFNLMSRPVV